jgi:hypothetical protein
VLWIKVDLNAIPEFQREREFTRYVWDFVERKEGDEYEQARYHNQSLGVISEPRGFVAQIDWAKCRKCAEQDLTVKGLCRKCRGPLL